MEVQIGLKEHQRTSYAASQYGFDIETKKQRTELSIQLKHAQQESIFLKCKIWRAQGPKIS